MSRPVITAAPAAPLTMEEVKFWLEIMREHALFIKMGLPAENTALIQEADCFYKDFGNLLNRANKVAGDKQFMRLVADSIDVVAEFLRFKRHLTHQMLVCKVIGNNPPLMIDHMAREAEYVLALFGKIKSQVKNYHLSKARENVFWLRIMADHTKLIRGRIDPSERAIIHTVDDFSNEFDDLFLEANDFYSMLTHPAQLPAPALDKKTKKGFYGVMPHLNPPAYDRFTRDVRSSVLRLRDFKKALHKMVVDCRIVSILPALLADHVRREADHFLMVLAMMEKGMVGVAGDYFEQLTEVADETNSFAILDENACYQPGSVLSQEAAVESTQACFDDDDDDDDDDVCDDEEDDCDDDDDDDDDDVCEDEENDCDNDVDDDDDDDDDWKELPDPKLVKPKYISPKFMPLEKGVREPDENGSAEPAAVEQSDQPSPPPAVEAKQESQIKWSGKWPRPLGKMKE